MDERCVWVSKDFTNQRLKRNNGRVLCFHMYEDGGEKLGFWRENYYRILRKWTSD